MRILDLWQQHAGLVQSIINNIKFMWNFENNTFHVAHVHY